MSPADLVAIVANLFENAIHGAMASGEAKPCNKLRIYPKSFKLVIRIENTCKRRLNYPAGFPVEKYGVGISSVQQAVRAYDGELSLVAENGVFTSLVLLNCSDAQSNIRSVPNK